MIFGPSFGLYILLMIPPTIFAIWAAAKTRSAFGKYSKIGNSSNMTGAEAAARMLEGQGIQVVGSSQQAQQMENAVAIEATKGFLSDHYDPKHKVLRLSPQVYQGRSLSAVGVACHEAGHALQDAKNYAPLGMRSALVPPVAIGSKLAFPLVIIGVILAGAVESVGMGLAWAGLVGFGLVVLFQLVTLPVEFNASSRAKVALADLGVIRGREEERGVAKVLDAAALTYVAALVMALGQMLYLLMIVAGARR